MTTQRPRVLLVEDNPALAESIQFALMTFGLDVVGPLDSNAESTKVLTSASVDVAILDLDLGHETSIPTAKRLRNAGIPFLIMSGHDMEDEVPAEFQAEVCLPKPVDPEILVETIRELLEMSGVRNPA
ncbi:MAG: response regulator [Planctomycetota bacterium]